MNDETNFDAERNFMYALTIMFVVLRLMGYIHWSWWWILSPLWIPLAVTIILGFIVSIFGGHKDE